MQNWQASGYYGNMIASNNDFLAYVLESRSGFVVRLIQLKTKDWTLLKKFTGKICDLSFAHASSNVLGVVDQAGNLHVYDLDEAHGDMSKMGLVRSSGFIEALLMNNFWTNTYM